MQNSTLNELDLEQTFNRLYCDRCMETSMKVKVVL